VCVCVYVYVCVQRLRFYGLYKQATQGDVATDRPGMFSPTDRAKW
jgi:diazepam-binding inhibitor (GABA receptor modulating acyl-CoA-binding protein)